MCFSCLCVAVLNKKPFCCFHTLLVNYFSNELLHKWLFINFQAQVFAWVYARVLLSCNFQSSFSCQVSLEADSYLKSCPWNIFFTVTLCKWIIVLNVFSLSFMTSVSVQISIAMQAEMFIKILTLLNLASIVFFPIALWYEEM